MTETRKERAIAIREVLLPWLQDHGRDETIAGHRMRRGEIGDFLILYRTPFSGPFGEPEAKSYETAQLLQEHGPVNFPYGLDLFHARRKVMNIEWGHRGEIAVVGFRAGDWETQLLGAIGRTLPKRLGNETAVTITQELHTAANVAPIKGHRKA